MMFECGDPEQIPDPWNSENTDKADMWIRVDYEKTHVAITLANACMIEAKECRRALKTHRWIPITDIGGEGDPIDIASNLFGMQVRIPYAAYLNS